MADGWVMSTDTLGVYGAYYLESAIVTKIRLGANFAEDPRKRFDASSWIRSAWRKD